MPRTRSTLAATLAIIAVALGLPAIAGASAPPKPLPKVPSSAYQDPATSCGCHAQFLGTWQVSMHAKALSDPLFVTKVAEADKATNGALGPYCNSCHSPIAVMAGEVKSTDQSKVSPQGKAGVQCDFCHQLAGSTRTPPGNFSFVVKPDGVKRGPLKDAKAPHRWAYEATYDDAAFCGNCHNVDHPVNGMHLEATYTEWKNGPYAKEGIRCQDCHMTPGPGVVKPNPGQAAGGGPQRDHIYTMTFAGGNVGLGDAANAEERLKAAARIEVSAPDIVTGGAASVASVTVTNVGAGHYLPTGLTEVRQMWLEVKAVDGSGAEIASAKRVFGTELKDAKGNHPVELWDAVGVYKDDRIPPREAISEPIEFAMPAKGSVKITAALYYRSASEEFAKKAGVELPTTLMASAEKAIFTSQADLNAATGGTVESSKQAAASTDSNLPLVLSAVGLLAVVGVLGFQAVMRRRRAS